MDAPLDHTVVTSGNIVVFVGVRPPTADVVEHLDREVAASAKQNPKGLGYVHAIYPRSADLVRKGVDDDASKALFRSMRNNAEVVRASLYVVGVGGMVGAAVRMLVSGFIITARIGGPFKVVGSVDEGLAWFQEHLRRGGADVPADRAIHDALAEGMQRLGIEPATPTS